MTPKTTIATISTEMYVTELKTDTHLLQADEPTDNGGKDLGPSPGDLLRMSLASCTAITLRMYANRKNLGVQQIEVMVSSEQQEGKTTFRRSIEITGSLTAEQNVRMLQIANACPVHKMLTNPIEIETALTVKI
jgi:putative redox protein